MIRRASKEKMVNIFVKNPEISTQLSYVLNSPVNQSIAIRADNG
jgi:hypothetical protein